MAAELTPRALASLLASIGQWDAYAAQDSARRRDTGGDAVEVSHSPVGLVVWPILGVSTRGDAEAAAYEDYVAGMGELGDGVDDREELATAAATWSREGMPGIGHTLAEEEYRLLEDVRAALETAGLNPTLVRGNVPYLAVDP